MTHTLLRAAPTMITVTALGACLAWGRSLDEQRVAFDAWAERTCAAAGAPLEREATWPPFMGGTRPRKDGSCYRRVQALRVAETADAKAAVALSDETTHALLGELDARLGKETVDALLQARHVKAVVAAAERFETVEARIQQAETEVQHEIDLPADFWAVIADGAGLREQPAP